MNAEREARRDARERALMEDMQGRFVATLSAADTPR